MSEQGGKLPDDSGISNDATEILALYAGRSIFGDRFVLEKKLGRGASGEVWLAVDSVTRNKIALKFPAKETTQDAKAIKNLIHETNRVQKLKHANILSIYFFHQEGSLAAISMEYVDGATLEAFQAEQSNGVFEVSQIAEWVKQLCEALEFAHSKAKVVHHDLKPANLMINSEGELRVADFGISRSIKESHARITARLTHEQAGFTLPYASPQQLDGEHPSSLDDIYSMGATIFELLTGYPPFYRGDIHYQVRNVKPPSMSQRRQELQMEGLQLIPKEWDSTIAACLAKNPADRPRSALQVARDLGLIQTTMAAAPAPPPTPATTATQAAPTTTSATATASPPTATHPTTSPTEIPEAIPPSPPPATAPKPWLTIAMAVFAVVLCVVVAIWVLQKEKRPEVTTVVPATNAVDLAREDARKAIVAALDTRDATRAQELLMDYRNKFGDDDQAKRLLGIADQLGREQVKLTAQKQIDVLLNTTNWAEAAPLITAYSNKFGADPFSKTAVTRLADTRKRFDDTALAAKKKAAQAAIQVAFDAEDVDKTAKSLDQFRKDFPGDAYPDSFTSKLEALRLKIERAKARAAINSQVAAVEIENARKSIAEYEKKYGTDADVDRWRQTLLDVERRNDVGGLIVIPTPADALVSVGNGTPQTGRTVLPNFRSGTHPVLVSKAGYEVLSNNVVVTKGKTNTVNLPPLARSTGTLQLSTAQEGITYDVRGKEGNDLSPPGRASLPQGQPVALPLFTGTYDLIFHRQANGQVWADVQQVAVINRREQTPVKAEFKEAKLQLSAEPPSGVAFEVNGQKLAAGTYTVPTGEYRITATYSNWQPQRITNQLTAGGTFDKPFKFLGADIQLDSVPTGARVLLGNRDLGPTPFKTNGFPLGSYEFSFQFKGYETAKTNVLVTTAGLMRKVTLVKMGAVKPNERTNALGMKFKPVLVGEQWVLFSVWETRVRDFKAFVDETKRPMTGKMRVFIKGNEWTDAPENWEKPFISSGPEDPVCAVSWDDASEFCAWLTRKDKLGKGEKYRLPKDIEWSVAAGIGIEPGNFPAERMTSLKGAYYWGVDQKTPGGAGNFAAEEWIKNERGIVISRNADSLKVLLPNYRDEYKFAAPVGRFRENSFGLKDMGGNVSEWCEDWFDSGKHERTIRDGSWMTGDSTLLVARWRGRAPPDSRVVDIGFRCVIDLGDPE